MTREAKASGQRWENSHLRGNIWSGSVNKPEGRWHKAGKWKCVRLLEFVLVTFFSCSCISEFSTLWGCFLLQIGKWNRKGQNTDVQQKFLVSCCGEKQRPRGAHGLCACRLLSGSRSVSTVGVLTSHWDQQWLKAVCKEVYCWLDMLCNSDKMQNASDCKHTCEMMGL